MIPTQYFTIVRAILLLAVLWSGQYAFSASLIDQLTQKFQGRISILDREMVAFRYESKTKDGLTSVPALQARVQGWGERFFDKAVVSMDIAGPGNYMAIDPLGSRGFGSNNPQLFVFSLKKGIRILSLESGLKKDEKEIIKKIHNDLQCKNKNGNEEQLIEEARMDYFSLRQSSTESCREVAINVGRNLNIQAILYPYMASNGLADCRQRGAAINIVSSEAIDFSKAHFFSNQYSFETAGDGMFIKKIYSESQEDFNILLNQNGDEAMPAELARKDLPSDDEYSRWKKSKIYNCGPKWAPEEQVSLVGAVLDENFRLNYKNNEVLSLLLLLKKAFAEKAQNKKYFRISDLRKFKNLSFKVSGLAQDSATLERWLFLSNHMFEEKHQEEIKKMYGISKTLQDISYNEPDLEAMLKKMTPQQLKSPELYLRLLGRFQIYGGYARVVFNEINMYKGGVILSSMDQNKTFAENLEISKRAYTEAIKECISVYSNPNLTYEEILKTDCGVMNE